VNEPNEFEAYFIVSGDFDPAEITGAMGLEPSDQCRKGDRFGKEQQVERKFSRWRLRSRLPRASFLEEHVTDVLEQLEPVKHRVAALSSLLEPRIHGVAFFNDSASGFFFTPETISALAELKLAFDVALYYEGGDENADIVQ